jgi:arylformamidase
MSRWIDISVTLRTGMPVWPGDRAFEVRRDLAISRGDRANLSSFSTTAHVGTHMDAPLHFIDGAASIDKVPLDVLIGAARVIGIEDASKITAEELERHDLKRGERILCRTANSLRDWAAEPFTTDFVALNVEAARYAASRGIAFLCVDYLSVGPYGGDDGADVHRLLLGAGIWIVEGLNLREAEPGRYELICLPLRISGAEGSPARAILRKDEHSIDT